MKTQSIFLREWWAVALRAVVPAGAAGTPEKRLDALTSDVAKQVGGKVHEHPRISKPGLYVVSKANPTEPEYDTAPLTYVAMLQTGNVYFPLAEGELEIGHIDLDDIATCERDFPRRIRNGAETLFQYPLLFAFSQRNGFYALAAPYYRILKDILNGLRPGKFFSACLAIDVAQTYRELQKAKIENGILTVRSGRMIIDGIPNLRSAVFFGDNVIESDLYKELKKRPDTTVVPKDCRLGRSYGEPVGGNRRSLVSWFDPHGNFRFTPGGKPTATMCKYTELLDVLHGMKLVGDAESANPLQKIGHSSRTS